MFSATPLRRHETTCSLTAHTRPKCGSTSLKGYLNSLTHLSGLKSRRSFLKKTMAVEKGYCVRYAMQSAIHALWRERNKRKHEEPHTHVHVFKKIV